jgi:hypothetical protein
MTLNHACSISNKYYEIPQQNFLCGLCVLRGKLLCEFRKLYPALRFLIDIRNNAIQLLACFHQLFGT